MISRAVDPFVRVNEELQSHDAVFVPFAFILQRAMATSSSPLKPAEPFGGWASRPLFMPIGPLPLQACYHATTGFNSMGAITTDSTLWEGAAAIQFRRREPSPFAGRLPA